MNTITKVYKVGKFQSQKIEEVFVFDTPNKQQHYLMKAVVEDGGLLELYGKIKVMQTAVGTDTFLRQRVLLLGEKSRAVVVPELEIQTNEVKAGHAASIGRIDEEQLFYLMSRGLSKSEATKLLVKAFLDES